MMVDDCSDDLEILDLVITSTEYRERVIAPLHGETRKEHGEARRRVVGC